MNLEHDLYELNSRDPKLINQSSQETDLRLEEIVMLDVNRERTKKYSDASLEKEDDDVEKNIEESIAMTKGKIKNYVNKKDLMAKLSKLKVSSIILDEDKELLEENEEEPI